MQRKKSRQDWLFLYSGVIGIYNVGLRGRKPENQENNCCRRQEHTINYSWLQAGIKLESRWRETSAVTTVPSLLQEFQSTHFSHNTNETKSILIPLRYDVMADGLHVTPSSPLNLYNQALTHSTCKAVRQCFWSGGKILILDWSDMTICDRLIGNTVDSKLNKNTQMFTFLEFF